MNNLSSQTVKGPVALKNVAAFMAMTVRLRDRSPQLSGLGVFNGFSGYGKTWASIYAQNKTRAIRVEVGDSWTRRSFLTAILREFGGSFRGRASIADLAEMAIAALGEDPSRPLFIDEADRLVDKGFIELVRELHESSGAPVVMIGEEKLPAKLLQYERVHNRVLDWCPAQPCDIEDTRALADAFLPTVSIQDDLLDTIRRVSGGRARRIVDNIDRASVIARNLNVKTLDTKLWGTALFSTGEPPATRHTEMYQRAKNVRAA